MGIRDAKKRQREDVLIAQLRKKQEVRTEEAVRLLDVSEATARRIFAQMEREGEIVRTYGGIRLAPIPVGEYRYELRQAHETEEKKRIAAYASHIIADGDSLFLDSGTTMEQVSQAIAQRLHYGDLRDIRVFTNSLKNLMILSNYCEVGVIGGTFRPRRQDFTGYISEIVLNTLSFEKCFLGADGISPEDGTVMAIDAFTARINSIVADHANSVYMMADSTKFGRRSFVKYMDVSKVHTFVTDTGLSDADAARLRNYGTEIVRV